ncbi:GAF domain-containing sensor histidine kinase [Pontibacillus marinus]|uniref:histidine kinase n=1 Tax=Pontibacillus marinus BH030004 = DSM 16465 TaxID=1385511 RepID=A0A0A5GKZ9_9BACI|nr:ATP-binding protein [Pontibacillus marinus]KGX91893.1 hypothetical protein N783_00725 [Pontibacillus marinus BH030004 = DSM 16465]
MENVLQKDLMHALVGEVTDGYMIIDNQGDIVTSDIDEIVVFNKMDDDREQKKNIWNLIDHAYKNRLQEMVNFICENKTISSYFLEVDDYPRVVYQVRVFPFNNFIGIVFWDVTVEQNIRQAIEENYKSLSLLHDAAEDIIHKQTPKELLDSLFDKLSEELGLDIYVNYILDPEVGKIYLMNHKGIPSEVAEEIKWLEMGQAVCGTVAQTETRMCVENIPQSTDPLVDLIKSLGIKTYACHPLYSKGKLIGTLSFGSSHKERFTQSELDLLEKICDQIAKSLEKSFMISELKETNSSIANMNQKLKEQQQRLTNIFEGAIDGIVITDQDFTIIDANSAALDLLEVRDKDTLPFNFFNLFPDEEKALAKKYAKDLIENGKVYGEIHVNSIKGKRRVIGFSGVLDINPDRNLIIYRDITHQKELEKELIKVKNEAERANQAKTDFLLEMSHEFRTPLNTVIGYSELLQELDKEGFSDQQRDRIQKINHAGQELLYKVNQIIKYTSEDQEKEFSQNSIHVSSLFNRIFQHLKLEAEQNQIKLDLLYSDVDFIKINGDQEQLFQALKEIVRNGIQYNYTGGVVQSKAYKEAGKFIIEIIDSGIGLSEQQINHLYNPFKRNEENHHNTTGMGMGLSIALRIIHELKGTLSVTSEMEKGSIFKVSIPICLKQ